MSDIEKRDSSRDEHDDINGNSTGLPPDPDAHLSQEEKDNNVRGCYAYLSFL